jgi:ankyrin repeat protein
MSAQLQNDFISAFLKLNWERTLIALIRGANPNDIDSELLPINAAIEYNRPEIVEALIRLGADPNKPSCYGISPLHAAAIRGDTDSMRLLIKAQAHIDAIDDLGKTPLHHAVESRSVETVQILVDAGANQTLRNIKGKRPLDLAVKTLDDQKTPRLKNLRKIQAILSPHMTSQVASSNDIQR